MSLQRLQTLHQKHNGPIPRKELDRALGRDPAMRGAKKLLADTYTKLQQAHIARQRFDANPEGYTDEAWDDWDTRLQNNLNDARSAHDKALQHWAALTADRLPLAAE